MDNMKNPQWKQSFDHFKRSYKMLDKYVHQNAYNDIERAGVIHFFKMTIELSLKVLKEYLEAQGYEVKSHSETIKQAYQIELIENRHTWLEALSKRNLTSHTYDESMAEKMVHEIKDSYISLLRDLYDRLEK